MTSTEYVAAVKALSPDQVIAYLQAKGWQEDSNEGEHGRHVRRFVSLAYRMGEDETGYVLVPIDDLRDRTHLFFAVIEELQAVEGRPATDLLRDIQSGATEGIKR